MIHFGGGSAHRVTRVVALGYGPSRSDHLLFHNRATTARSGRGITHSSEGVLISEAPLLDLLHCERRPPESRFFPGLLVSWHSHCQLECILLSMVAHPASPSCIAKYPPKFLPLLRDAQVEDRDS